MTGARTGYQREWNDPHPFRFGNLSSVLTLSPLSVSPCGATPRTAVNGHGGAQVRACGRTEGDARRVPRIRGLGVDEGSSRFAFNLR